MRLAARRGALAFSVPSHSVAGRLSFSTNTPSKRNQSQKPKGQQLPLSKLLSRKIDGKPGLKNTAKSAGQSRSDSISQGHDPKSRLRLNHSKKYTGRHGVFRSTVLHRLEHVLELQATSTHFAQIGMGEDELSRQASQFMNAIDQAFELAEQNVTRRDKNPLFWNLRDAFVRKDIRGLTKEVQYSFQSFLVRQRFSKSIEENQKRLLDFRYPHEWFPATRTLQRKIHVHVGPTNSGKTYRALKALESSKRGVYAGPLRLLAAEVYQRLRAKNLPCALITGEEVRIPDDTDNYFSSCTVEMVPLNVRYDVAVIDEIQMIGHADRGNAWTNALLGVQADEVHVCGEERTVPLLQAICGMIGDECIVHRYDRLTPLQTMTKAIEGDYDQLQKGDAIVAFSRLSLHVLKHNIEHKTGRRCAIIYGSLPPEVRVQQASLFNDPDNDYDFLVASDAIGMGMNLEVRRVIFESVTKFDGAQNRLLTYPEIKQIGGRAGRYRTARHAATHDESPVVEEDKVGLVTTMDYADLRSVHRAFQREVEDIEVAYIEPPTGIVEKFASYFPPDTPLSFILMRIAAAAAVGPNYKLNINASALEVADAVQDIPLSIYDRLTFCNLPVNLRAEGSLEVLRALANIVATNAPGDLLSIAEIPLEILDIDVGKFDGRVQEYLYKLESLHVSISQYIWLTYRYTGMFKDQALGFHIRSLVEEKLIQTLEQLDFTEEQLEVQRQAKRRLAKSYENRMKAKQEGQEGRDHLREERELLRQELDDSSGKEAPPVQA